MKKYIEENKAYIIFYAILLFTGLFYAIFNSAGKHTDKIVFLILGCISVVFILYKMVFSHHKTPLIWILCVFALILTFVHILNPNNRIYSHHGFMHGGITYRILNGQIPPDNPLLAGKELLYPWGYEFAAAAITYTFNITPFYSYAILNITSLIAVMFLVYKISQLLIRDNNACILSVIISIYGTTIFNKYLLVWLRRINIFGQSNPFIPEYRGVPIFNKFLNINGVPIGLVLYLVLLFSIIKIFIGKKPVLYTILVFLSILAMGFVYPQFLPGLFASTICICLVNILLHSKEKRIYLRKVFLIIAPLIISLLIMLPYIFSISSGIKGGIELFKMESVLANTVSYLIVCFPVLLVVFFNRKFLWNHVDRTALVIIVTSAIITFGCYVCMHMSYNNEYKALLLSEISLGILGGIALSNMKQRRNEFIVFIVLIVCMFPIFDSIKAKLDHLGTMPIMFTENGKVLCAKDTEEKELYEWIRRETNVNDIFFDTTPNIPVFAQRQLFIGMDTIVKGKDEKGQQFQIYNPGYNYGIRGHLEKTCGYDPTLVRNRYDILEKIYNPNQELTQGQKKELFSSNDRVYIIVRKAMFPKSYVYRLFDKVFQSSQGNFSVYCYRAKKPF